jgi:hypothetical protein
VSPPIVIMMGKDQVPSSSSWRVASIDTCVSSLHLYWAKMKQLHFDVI